MSHIQHRICHMVSMWDALVGIYALLMFLIHFYGSYKIEKNDTVSGVSRDSFTVWNFFGFNWYTSSSNELPFL